MFETLEMRRLLNIDLNIVAGGAPFPTTGQLQVSLPPRSEFSGTARNDHITVASDPTGDELVVRINGVAHYTAADRLVIYANAGNDKVHIDLPADIDIPVTIHGGAGDDTIFGSAAAERIVAGDGNDLVNANGGRDTLYGEGGDDSLRGGGSSDYIDGGAGDDTLRGDAGNDRILGGDGFDRLRGSAGNDSIAGGASKDWIGGETGDDHLEGEGGADVLAGGENDDVLVGGAGEDQCDGNDGNDVLSGGSGFDRLTGSGGNDGFDPAEVAAECLDIEIADIEYAGSSLTAHNTVLSNYNLTKTGGGTLILTGANAYTGSLTVTGGRLDLSDNKLILNGSTGSIYDGVQGLVQRAMNGSTWGSGITSIGVATGAEASAGQTAVFAGQTITAADTIAMYTYSGDANLDGFISADDYTAIDFAVGTPGSSGWAYGDFNYDGFISADDYTAIDFNAVGGVVAVNPG